MVEKLSVSVSGPAFSFLLYENIKCDFDQEGFLLGEVVEKETNTITDNDEQVTKIDRIIKINSAVPCPHMNFFYDGVGRVDVKRITELLGDQFMKVIAWYKFKHTNAFRLTLREKLVHKELAKLIGSTPELFVCCLLTTDSSTNSSTHLYGQSFLRHYKTSYQMLPMHIVNLSDPNNVYKSPEPCSETFGNIVKSLLAGSGENKLQGFNKTTRIQAALQKHIDQVVMNLTESEQCLFDLEEEIKDLQNRLAERDCASSIIVENGNDEDETNCNSNVNHKRGGGGKRLTEKHEADSLESADDNNKGGRIKASYAQAVQKSKN